MHLQRGQENAYRYLPLEIAIRILRSTVRWKVDQNSIRVYPKLVSQCRGLNPPHPPLISSDDMSF